LNIQRLKKYCVFAVVCYLVAAIAFVWIAGDQLHFREETTDMVNATQLSGLLTDANVIEQPFLAGGDELREISLLLSSYGQQPNEILVRIVDKEGKVIDTCQVAVQTGQRVEQTISFSNPVELAAGETYSLVVAIADETTDGGVEAWYGNTVNTIRAEIALDIPESERLKLGGEAQEGKLCYAFRLRSNLWIGEVYWFFVLAMGLLLAAYCVYLIRQAKNGEETSLFRLMRTFKKYEFLMRQLIGRDFKTKYKRSVLGVFWSFLNPLLTMSVQYFVFSTLFKSDIPNFSLYLLTGIVCFNFFNEASGMALMSIVGNAPLITKVYVPKYIYPISRVLSSSINLLLSMLPLFAVALLTGAPIRPALLMLPFGLACLVSFSIGVGLFLSTAMVFFRDTQFLWGVISMLWMYATPIFYPESIIPQRFLPLYKCNPMYHFLDFVRTILMDGVSPEPGAYVLCFLMACVPLVIGSVVFKLNQDKFVLNL